VQAPGISAGRKGCASRLPTSPRGQIPTYTVEAKGEKGRIIVEVSKKAFGAVDDGFGGSAGEQTLYPGDGGKRAGIFGAAGIPCPACYRCAAAAEQGYSDLRAQPGRVLRYGESVKVQVSAADGSILGFWGTPYYTAQSGWKGWNTSRVKAGLCRKNCGKVWKCSMKAGLNTRSRTGGKCSPKGRVRYQDEYYLIYLNAETGEEEQIVQVSSPCISNAGLNAGGGYGGMFRFIAPGDIPGHQKQGFAVQDLGIFLVHILSKTVTSMSPYSSSKVKKTTVLPLRVGGLWGRITRPAICTGPSLRAATALLVKTVLGSCGRKKSRICPWAARRRTEYSFSQRSKGAKSGIWLLTGRASEKRLPVCFDNTGAAPR